MFDPDIENKTLYRLDEDPPFIMELTSVEVVMLGAASLLAAIGITVGLISLLAGTGFWMFGFAGMLTGWPIGKKLFIRVNEMKKGKPYGYVGHRAQILLGRWISILKPAFIYHKGTWEVDR